MKLISHTTLRIYYLTVFAVCSIIGYSIYTNSRIRLTTKISILSHTQLQLCKGYDLKIIGKDHYRLGFATQLVKSHLQVLPKSWEYQLSKIKPVKYENWPENIVLNLKSKLQTSTKVKVEQLQLAKKIIIKPMKIFMYSRPSWLRVNPSDSFPIINPEYKCEYIDWNLPAGGDGSISQIKNISRNADAILVHSANTLNATILDLIYSHRSKKSNEKLGTPKLIYFTLESPSYTRESFVMNIQNKNRARDLLASYWRGSDIYTPFSRWHTLNNTTTNEIPNKNYAEGRTKMAAIVVSNCHPSNNRMEFVNQLQKFITVDIFGKCGTFDCRQTDCFDTIRKNYKFYLAFENSNCRDYITEKFYKNAYSNDLLPIVLGAHPADYKAVAPPNSYIHVEDFESVENLGRYLLQLHHDDTLYNSYFKWKRSGTFNNGNRALREICAYLHTQDLNVKENENTFKFGLDGNLSENSKSREIMMPYFNTNDEYNFNTFYWSTQDDRLCLNNNEWYWNK